MIQAIGLGNLPRVEISAYNRLAGTTACVIGGVYALDIAGANAASTSPDTNLQNVVATSSAAPVNYRGILVVALGTTANGALGRFVLQGLVPVLVDGTTAVMEGDKLIPQTASVNAIKHTTSTAIAPLGVAMEALASGTALVQTYFDGMTWRSGNIS